jgi:hypothetical protein
MVTDDKNEVIICQALAEIERHKWLVSERIGKDIGGNLAAMDFLLNHYERWLDHSLHGFSRN